jgi:hypothetical protein
LTRRRKWLKIALVAKKKSLVTCLGLTLLLFSCLSPFAGPELVSASPDKLKWSIVDTPSEEAAMVVSPSEINAIVVGSDDETFYTIDIPHSKVYKSTDGGVTWEDDLTDALTDEGATLPAWDIAVAPDDRELVAVVTNNRTAVYVSEDGGKEWVNTNLPDLGALLISDIAISPEYGGDRDIAIGTRNPDGSTNGDIWVIRRLGFPGWEAQGLGMDVTSLCFSPNYAEDEVMLAIASDNITGSYLCTRYKVDDEWEDVIPPVEIKETGSSPKESEIIFSDLTLKSADYAKDADWIVYAAYYSTTEADDAYRIKHEREEEDARVRRLRIEGGDKVSLASIDYSGGKLLAGEVLGDKDSATALIHLCANPEERFPDWEEPGKPPTGGAISGRANAQLVWSSGGKVAYCGTSSNNVTSAADWKEATKWNGQPYDESSFSLSNDDGDTWNQLSLIDTAMGKLCDFALSADAKSLYLASVGSGFDSLWRSQSDPLGETWQRILCFDSETDDIILRADLEEDEREAIFLAVRDTDYARYSLDEGQTWKWFWRRCPNVTDLAVVNDELLYVLDDNLVNKGTWNKDRGIWEWDRDIDTGLLSGYTIATSGEDFVFVGEDEDGEGKIAYSTDGGASFELTEEVPEPGKMLVIPDEEFNSNRFIYAASSEGKIYRWAIEGSISWRELNPRPTGFCGLAQKGGALYGTHGPGVVRTLIPHLETVEEDDWDSLKLGLPDEARFKPGTLRAMRDEAIDLWAIDDTDYFNGALDPDNPSYDPDVGRLWVYSDTFVLATPWPTSPALGELVPCDPCTCQARTFFFRWRELYPSEEYELWVALDEKFDYMIIKAENITPDNIHDPAWCLSLSSFHLGCGDTYYWKVRSCQTTEGERVHSRWSPPMNFTVKTCSAIEVMHIAPILKVPESGSRGVSRLPGFSWLGFPHTTKYEFILAKDAGLTEIVVKEKVPTSAYICSSKLDWDTTYFWQVTAVEPVPSEPSAISVFTVMPQPQPTLPAVPVTPSATPFWIWLVIGILALLTAVIIVLCLVKR